MKRYGLTLFILTVAVGVNAQVSVYDCGVYDKNMTQTEVNNSPQTIHAACITLGENGNMNIGSTTQKTFIASDEITLKDDVTLGVFAPGGEVHLKNGEKSGNLDVAVMNYASLHGVLRYKKLEFGIEVPANILSRINHYLHNEGAFTDELNPFLEWDGFMKPPASSIDQPSITWASTIRAQNHFNANDFISTLSNGYGFWAQGRQAEKHSSAKGKYDVAAVETQYFISANQEKAVGYVRNRTYNVHTKRTNSDCDMDWGDIEPIDDLIDIEWDDLEASRRLKIQKLKSNTDYNVDWYSFKTGVYLKSDCLNTQGQNLILHYPKLSVEGYQIDNPVVWFVVYQKNCQQSRAESGEESMQDQEQENFVDLSTNKLLTQDVSIYPNPFNSELNVNNLKQNDTVIVYDIMGKKVKEYAVFEGDNKLATSSLGEGVYIVHLLQSRTHYRLIKK